MTIEHRCFNIVVACNSLNEVYVCALLNHVRKCAMPDKMSVNSLFNF